MSGNDRAVARPIRLAPCQLLIYTTATDPQASDWRCPTCEKGGVHIGLLGDEVTRTVRFVPHRILRPFRVFGVEGGLQLGEKSVSPAQLNQQK